ncbi:hypothetical protein KIPB_000629 [Kipferlia bialata]|uniref:Pre-mRNA-splicing factor 18 n=1 Tax=Kipferlia bialata TaxID=797122 RepID=A0A9K3CMM5_9EUKA|nr:hypothetical protein KIPB_000629 [Kipferlia bialata]|eukprot:g629.t1
MDPLAAFLFQQKAKAAKAPPAPKAKRQPVGVSARDAVNASRKETPKESAPSSQTSGRDMEVELLTQEVPSFLQKSQSQSQEVEGKKKAKPVKVEPAPGSAFPGMFLERTLQLVKASKARDTHPLGSPQSIEQARVAVPTERETKVKARQAKEGGEGEGAEQDEEVSQAEEVSKPPTDYRMRLCLYVLKRVLREWEVLLLERSETHTGLLADTEDGEDDRISKAWMKNYSDYYRVKQAIRPMFAQLGRTEFPADMIEALHAVAEALIRKDYSDARVWYMNLSVGVEAWPLGIAPIGHHGRAALDGINSNVKSHVLHSESAREYLHSIKELVTFAEQRFPPQ